jgi:hypothetical protein
MSKLTKNFRNRPIGLLILVFLIMPICLGLVVALTSMGILQSTGHKMNYIFGYSVIGLSYFFILCGLVRLAYHLDLYTFRYFALRKFLRQKGLEEWADEADEIKSLRD